MAKKKSYYEYVKAWRKNNIEKARKYNREYYYRHKERILKQEKTYRNKNLEKIKNLNKEYRKNHKKEITKQASEYYKENRDRILKYHRKHYQKNKNRIYRKQKEWRKNHPEKTKKYFQDWSIKNPDKVKVRGIKQNAIRKRNLGFNLLFKNIIDEKVEYHHINNIDVIAIPYDIHQLYYGYKHHKELCINVVKQLYLKIEKE